jgi:hypothetical protein
MASVTDRKDAEEYRGRSPESIVRRIWGRSAELQAFTRIGVEPMDSCFMAEVTRKNRYGTRVLAHVVVRP